VALEEELQEEVEISEEIALEEVVEISEEVLVEDFKEEVIDLEDDHCRISSLII